jgi:uncharacterized membrane protein
MPMLTDPATLVSLLWGTVSLRPYVFIFLIVFLVTATRDLGAGRAALFLLWGWGVAFAAEYASTRVGIPFGLYHYTGQTRGIELYLSNVPFFDSLSFPFLAYAAFCLSRRALGPGRGAGVVWLAGVLMMLLDVVVDPLAVRGDRWFLGRIFYYPAGGAYFGVPLSNFAGWMSVGWAIVGGYAIATRLAARPSAKDGEGSTGGGMMLYYGVLLFNLALTAWIEEWGLLAAGILVQAGAGLLLYGGGARRRREGFPPSVSVRHRAGRPGHDFDSTRSRGL